jgi:hypothetical protein
MSGQSLLAASGEGRSGAEHSSGFGDRSLRGRPIGRSTTGRPGRYDPIYGRRLDAHDNAQGRKLQGIDFFKQCCLNATVRTCQRQSCNPRIYHNVPRRGASVCVELWQSIAALFWV